MTKKHTERLDADQATTSTKEYAGKFCCQTLDDIANEEQADYRFIFNPMMREYYIKSTQAPYIRMIKFCPWCKTELPKSIRNELFSILENEYGIDPFIQEQRERVPAKFLTEAWWKERGL